jgi:hypothetical protein
MKGIKKTLFTLNIDNYCPEITKLTYPLLKFYANKIGADFHIITERKFPDWPVTYEKLQIYELGQQMGNDWNIYIDSDAVIHPDTLDWTVYINKDTMLHNGRDFANIRWRYNNYFRRDGRNWGSCNWFTIASDWCIDVWHPLDISFGEAVENIFPTAEEARGVTKRDHLIDDYALSYNIAKYGIKANTVLQLQKDLNFADSGFHFHLYNITEEQKINGWEETLPDYTVKKNPGIKEVLERTWRIPEYVRNYGNV